MLYNINMRGFIMKLRAVLITLAFALGTVLAFGQAATRIGADKCKLCHKVEFTSWEKTKHAAAKVECEDCHGAGSNYKTMAIMKDKAKAKAAGLITPTENDCKTCHTAKKVKEVNFADAITKVHDKKKA